MAVTFAAIAAEWLVPSVTLIPAWMWVMSPGHLVVGVALLVTVAGLAWAVFYHGSIDPALAIRKTAILGVTGSIVVFLFAIVETLCVNYIADAFGFADGTATLVAAGLVGVLLGPLYTQIRRRSEHYTGFLLPPTLLAEGPKRKTVVLFVDLVGYSALSAGDEPAALTTIALMHRAAHKQANAHGGRVVKTLGDGVLMEFDDAADGISAMVTLRAAVQEACVRSELPRPEFRTGIHFGEVAELSGDVFGDAVNLTARLQSIASPGHACVTEAVAQRLSSAGFEVTDQGVRTLPNLPVPVRCFAMSLASHAR